MTAYKNCNRSSKSPFSNFKNFLFFLIVTKKFGARHRALRLVGFEIKVALNNDNFIVALPGDRDSKGIK